MPLTNCDENRSDNLPFTCIRRMAIHIHPRYLVFSILHFFTVNIPINQLRLVFYEAGVTRIGNKAYVASRIGKNLTIEAGAIIRSGLTIGGNSIKVADSVVTKSILPEIMAIGIFVTFVTSTREWSQKHLVNK